MVPSFSRIRFWSVAPPRTLKPLEASPTVFTPGKACTIFKMSTSPKAIGIFFNWVGRSVSAPNCVLFTFCIRPEVMVTSSSICVVSSSSMSSVPSL